MIDIKEIPSGPFTDVQVAELFREDSTLYPVKIPVSGVSEELLYSCVGSVRTWGLRQVRGGSDTIIDISNLNQLHGTLEHFTWNGEIDPDSWDFGSDCTADASGHDVLTEQLAFRVLEPDPGDASGASVTHLTPVGTRLTKTAKIILGFDAAVKEVKIASEDEVAAQEEVYVFNRFGEKEIRDLVDPEAIRHLDWRGMLYDWLHEFNAKALTNETGRGAHVDYVDCMVAMYESKILGREIDGEISRLMIEMYIVFRRCGVQTRSSLFWSTCQNGELGRRGVLEAAILLLLRRDLIELAIPPKAERTAADDQEALKYWNRCKSRHPHLDADTSADFYVRT